MIEGIILDYDGTAANTVPWFHQQLQRVLQSRFNIHVNIEDIQEEMKSIFENMSPTVHNARNYLLKAWYRVGRNRGLSPLKSLWLVYETGKLVQSTDDIPPVTNGLKEFLTWCQEQNIKRALVSLSSRKRVLKFINFHELQHHFDHVFTKERVGKNKIVAFSKIVAFWKLDPRKIMVIGDLPGDAIAARKVGLKPVLLDTGFASRELLLRTNLVPVLHDFHEVLNFLLKEGKKEHDK